MATQYYGFKQWEPGEGPRRGEVNGALGKIDKAIHDVKTAGDADTAAVRGELAAAKRELEEAAYRKCELVMGSYVGNGKATQYIVLDFAPKAVLLEAPNGARTNDQSARYGLALYLHDLKSQSGDKAMFVTMTGFGACYNSEQQVFANVSGATYYYLAFK